MKRHAAALLLCSATLTSQGQTPELDALAQMQTNRQQCLGLKDAKKQAQCIDAVLVEALALSDKLAPRPKATPQIDPESGEASPVRSGGQEDADAALQGSIERTVPRDIRVRRPRPPRLVRRGQWQEQLRSIHRLCAIPRERITT